MKKTLTVEQFAEVLIDTVVKYHGLPDSIVTDRGSLFTSNFWTSLAFFLGVKRKLSTTFHPQTNGQTERQNSTMEQYLRAFVSFEQNDWVQWLPVAEFACNNIWNSTIDRSPFEAMAGYSPRMSWDEDINPRRQAKSAVETASHMQDLMKSCHEAILAAQKTQARYADTHNKARDYKVADSVWLTAKNLKTKRNRKLEQKMLGPFKIIDIIGKQAYRLELPPRWRIHDTFHVSLLEKASSEGKTKHMIADELENDEGDATEYIVGGIVDSHVFEDGDNDIAGGLHYLVHWKGYAESEDTWEPYSHVSHLKDKLRQFHERFPDKPTVDSAPQGKAKRSRDPVRANGPQGQPKGLPKPQRSSQKKPAKQTRK